MFSSTLLTASEDELYAATEPLASLEARGEARIASTCGQSLTPADIRCVRVSMCVRGGGVVRVLVQCQLYFLHFVVI